MRNKSAHTLLVGLLLIAGLTQAQTVTITGDYGTYCSPKSGTLQIQVSSGTLLVGSWEEGYSTANGFVTTLVHSIQTTTFNYSHQTDSDPIIREYRAYVSVSTINGGVPFYTQPVSVTIYPRTPDAGTVSGASQGLNSATGTLTYTGEGLTPTSSRVWKRRYLSADFLTGWETVATDVNTLAYSITESAEYRVEVNGWCGGASTSNTVLVEVYKAGTVGPGQSSCIEGSWVSLANSTAYKNIIRWEYSTDGGNSWTPVDVKWQVYRYQMGAKTTTFRTLVDLGPWGQQYSGTWEVTHTPYTMSDPVNGGNFIKEQTVTVAGIKNSFQVDALPISQKRKAIAYQDAYGRTVQQNISGASPTGAKDIITVAEYDRLGRPAVDYLPYASTANDGLYHSSAVSEQASFYDNGAFDKIEDSDHPFVKAVYENSPIGKLLEQGSAGTAWQPGSGNARRLTYASNSANEVRLFNLDLSSAQAYAANELIKIASTDPDEKNVQTFIDRNGRAILKRVELNEIVNGITVPWIETYYIYNESGNIAAIITPKGVQSLKAGPGGTWPSSIAAQGTAFKSQYVHQFTYDTRGRLIEKTVPGQLPLYYCYDRLDRLVLVQDGNLRLQNKWIYIKYDRLNRAIMQGLYTNTTYPTRAAIQLNVLDPLYQSPTAKHYEDRETTQHGYTNQSFPTNAFELLIVNYYDSYDFDYDGTPDYAYTAQGLPGENSAAASAVGLATGSKRLILGTTSWLTSYNFYDVKKRPVQVRSNNHLSAAIANLATVVYSFDDKVSISKNYHDAGAGRVTTVINKYTYDHVGRITHVYQNNNNAPLDQLVAKYDYNELGQLVDKKLHNVSGTTFLQSVDFRYNIRGWITSINNAELTSDSGVTNDETNDYFGMEFAYEKPVTGLANDNFHNGNISAVRWKGQGSVAGAGVGDQKSYKFTYDKSNRLTQTLFQMSNGATWTGEPNALNESQTYDLNGNILSLTRNQRKHQLVGLVPSYTSEVADNLTYTYNSTMSDRLTKIMDASGNASFFSDGTNASEDDYTYDTNGNLVSDQNKGISSIVYNHLGKATLVDFSDGLKVEYVYDADGVKLTMKIYEASTLKKTTDYVGSFVYTDGVLDFFASPEGRVVNNQGSLEYEYAIADQQGNTRVVFTSVNKSSTITATFEGNGSDQSSQFNLNDFPVVSHAGANHTPSGAKVISMNNPAGTSGIGPSKSLKVYPGDKIDIDVWEYHTNSSGFGTNSIPAATWINLISSVFGGVSGGAGEAGSIFSGVQSALTAWGTGGNQGTNRPAAYLNYILMDMNYKVLNMGSKLAPATANTKQRLFFNTINISEPSILFVYLSYENVSGNYVYFDDLKITHTKSNVLQYNEYYAFGLHALTSWTRENSENNFLYNAGSELSRTSGWYETPFRNYDPTIGRFTSIDPLATKYSSMSSYHYSFNNPAMFNDPTGAEGTWEQNAPVLPMFMFGPPDHWSGNQLTNPGFNPEVWAMIVELYERTTAATNGDGRGSWSPTGGYHYYNGQGQEVSGAGSNYTGYTAWAGHETYNYRWRKDKHGNNKSYKVQAGQQGDPIVFVSFSSTPSNFNIEEYFNELRTKLIENGFSSSVQVAKWSLWGSIKAWWHSSPKGTVTFTHHYGDMPIDAGGHARLNNPNSIIIYPGLDGRYGQANIDIWKYVNATLHEIGHGFFGFEHDLFGHTLGPPSVMDYRYAYEQGMGFNLDQQLQVISSIWGSP